MRMLQRSVGHSHSRDSAIDTDLQVRFKNMLRVKKANSYAKGCNLKQLVAVSLDFTTYPKLESHFDSFDSSSGRGLESCFGPLEAPSSFMNGRKLLLLFMSETYLNFSLYDLQSLIPI